MLKTLRARLKELVGVVTALKDKADMSAEDLALLKTKTAEIVAVEADIATLEAADAALARAALPADQPVITITQEAAVAATVKQPTTVAEKVGVMVFSMAQAFKATGNRSPEATFKVMEERGYGAVAKEFAGRQKALNSGSPAAGGVLLPDDMSSEIIDILRPATTFLRGNPRHVPLVNGSYRMPAAASGASAGWRGEGKAIQTSQPTFKDINMTTKFLDAMVPLTNQLIRWSVPDVKAWVEQDMAAAMGTELDQAAYTGAGTVNQPLGITLIPGIGEFTAQGTTTATVAQIEYSASQLELNMMNRNVPVERAAWRMSPRTFTYLSNLRDGNGNRYFPELQNANPTWRNKPVLFTTQIPINGGNATDESEIYLIDFANVLFGESAGISFAVSTEATYVMNGTTVSAFQNDLTLIKASMEADVDLRYLEAVQVMRAVRWGG